MRLSLGYPVETVLESLGQALAESGSAVLRAPPGAGKTTLVPPFLLDAPWLGSQKILMLEPRRLAARAAARRISHLLGDNVGGVAGYRTRLDSKAGYRTRIEVLTEGILTRMLQSDPSLEGVGLVIFDEFHERSVHADLGLALCLDAKANLREDLRILAMSATLDVERVASLLGGAPVLSCEGRMHKVETVHVERCRDNSIEKDMARALGMALGSSPGDILAFLPGEAEIRRVHSLLEREFASRDGILICPLYGNLPQEAQDKAIDPAPEGFRKIILATSIAETSLTIEGVRIVVDSGLMRVPRFCPRAGMGRLETVRVSQASAEQRRGRAGRAGPGLCLRLWGAAEQRSLAPFNAPEILESDLAPLVLELAKWGVGEDSLDSLKWLDPPPAAKFSQAAALLRELGALDEKGKITRHGEAMLGLPLHPRLAHMLVSSLKIGLGALACELASLLSERDVLKGANSDVRERLSSLLRNSDGAPGEWSGLSADRQGVRRAREAAAQLKRAAGISGAPSPKDIEKAGLLLALAYPDRIAKSRKANSGEYTLSNGSGAKLRRGDLMASCEFLAAAHVGGEAGDATIFLAAPIALEDIEKRLPELLSEDFSLSWDPERKAVVAERVRRLGRIAISRRAAMDSLPQDLLLKAFLEGLRKEGSRAIPWDDASLSIRERVGFLRKALGEEWPDMSGEALMESLEGWLAPFAQGCFKIEHLKKTDLKAALESMLDRRMRQSLDKLAPERIEVPSGSKLRIDYSVPEAPSLSARIQELFGLLETPRLAGGKIPLAIKMLSPSMRPVQTTSDLRSFWREGYFLVRKELRGRYPKHDWPEDPLSAEPSRGAKRRNRKE